MPTLPHPAAMLSNPSRPMTYAGRVLSTMRGSTRVTSLALATLAIPPPTHFPLPLTAKEVAKLNSATLNKQRCHEMATWEKALADEVNKQRCQVTAVQENALANDAYEQHYQELAKCNAASAELVLAAEQAALSTDLALPLTAVTPPPHCPTTYKDAVLSTMGGSLCAKSLVVAPLSCPSTTVDGQLQTACPRA
jgi:hypothetical protein